MLQLSGINKRFGDIHAVADVSFEIDRGEFIGLLGPNGAGKTTTINMITGKFPPDSGSIYIDGSGDASNMAIRRKIGIAPQDLAFYEELPAETNVRFFGDLYGLSGRQLTERVKLVLEQVGLYERRKDKSGNFSGGMKRRLNLAIAMVHDPEILLLDEPTVGVDPQSRNAIFEYIRQLHQEGRTILYTTHYMEEAQRLCDRVAIIDHGKLLTMDTVDNLLNKHATVSTVIVERATGTEQIETQDPKKVLADVLSDDTVESVRVERANLESVFLSLTGRRLRD